MTCGHSLLFEAKNIAFLRRAVISKTLARYIQVLQPLRRVWDPITI
jgi:hypothetical protein